MTWFSIWSFFFFGSLIFDTIFPKDHLFKFERFFVLILFVGPYLFCWSFFFNSTSRELFLIDFALRWGMMTIFLFFIFILTQKLDLISCLCLFISFRWWRWKTSWDGLIFSSSFYFHFFCKTSLVFVVVCHLLQSSLSFGAGRRLEKNGTEILFFYIIRFPCDFS